MQGMGREAGAGRVGQALPSGLTGTITCPTVTGLCPRCWEGLARHPLTQRQGGHSSVSTTTPLRQLRVALVPSVLCTESGT